MKIISYLLGTLLITAAHAIEKPSDVTFEWLCKGGDGDSSGHVLCMKEIFEKLNTRSVLEFGLGYSTKYFLDSCKRVVSVEVITHGYGPDRMQHFTKFYRDFSNWFPIAYFSGYRGDRSWAAYKYAGSDAVYTAGSYQCATHLSYEPIDAFYLQELGEFISNIVKFNKTDVALIHPILFLRGDLVELCFHKIPIVVAHDTVCRAKGEKSDAWGFARVKTPEDYEEIYIATPGGTTVWVSKKPEFQELINSLKLLQ